MIRGIASLAPENRESRKVREALARNDTIQRSHCEWLHGAGAVLSIKKLDADSAYPGIDR